jgi:hypothetical protein
MHDVAVDEVAGTEGDIARRCAFGSVFGCLDGFV